MSAKSCVRSHLSDSGISARSGTVEDICKRPTSNVQRPTLNSEQATACAYSNALLLQQDGARSISAQLPLALSPAEFCARAMRRTDAAMEAALKLIARH